jgi:hypothetical protein
MHLFSLNSFGPHTDHINSTIIYAYNSRIIRITHEILYYTLIKIRIIHEFYYYSLINEAHKLCFDVHHILARIIYDTSVTIGSPRLIV